MKAAKDMDDNEIPASSSFSSLTQEDKGKEPEKCKGDNGSSIQDSLSFCDFRHKRQSWTEEAKNFFWSQKKREKKQNKQKKKAEIKCEQQIKWEKLEESEREELRQKAAQKHERRRQQDELLDQQCQSQLSDREAPRLVFDLSFAWCMTPANTKSTVAQIIFSYCALRRAGFPFLPVITSLVGHEDGRSANASVFSSPPNDTPLEVSQKESRGLPAVVETSGDKEKPVLLSENDSSLLPASFSALCYHTRESAARIDSRQFSSALGELPPLLLPLLTCDAFKKYGCPIYIREHWSSIFDNEKVVFLTADAESILETVERDTVYIIGAFVDHNQHKFLSMNAATRYGVRTARLPIKEHIEVRNRCQILTINHVVDVLIQFTIRQNWTDALEAVLPIRRVHQEELGCRRKRRRALSDPSANKGESTEENAF